jgi:hypothetical protein
MGKRGQVLEESVGTISPEKGNCSRIGGKKSNEEPFDRTTRRGKPGQYFPII